MEKEKWHTGYSLCRWTISLWVDWMLLNSYLFSSDFIQFDITSRQLFVDTIILPGHIQCPNWHIYIIHIEFPEWVIIIFWLILLIIASSEGLSFYAILVWKGGYYKTSRKDDLWIGLCDILILCVWIVDCERMTLFIDCSIEVFLIISS